MAQRHDEVTAAGARIAGISVDPPGANAAMVDKLALPFPLLSDPDGSGAIKPYGLWSEEKGGIARPAIVVIGTDGEEAFRQDSRDFADRLTEDDLLTALRDFGLPETEQDPPRPGHPQPGERAFPVESMAPYYRGAKFAATSIGMRVPEAKEETEVLIAELERYAEATRRLVG